MKVPIKKKRDGNCFHLAFQFCLHWWVILSAAF
jgi:hypothetical protein